MEFNKDDSNKNSTITSISEKEKIKKRYQIVKSLPLINNIESLESNKIFNFSKSEKTSQSQSKSSSSSALGETKSIAIATISKYDGSNKDYCNEKNLYNNNLKNEKIKWEKDENKNNENNCINNDDDDDVDEEDVIAKIIGNYGLWQFVWTLILSLFQISTSFQMFSIVFQTAEKEFWCARPSQLKNINKDHWINLTQPKGSCTILLFDENSINENNYEEILYNASILNTLIECKNFEFDSYKIDMIGSTLIKEWNLLCDRNYLVSVIEMCFLAGVAVGSLTSGWLSDNFGRKHVLMSMFTIQISVGTLLAFIKSLTLFMILRFILGFAAMTVTSVSFVLVVELVGGKYQTMIGILNMLPVAFSYMIVSGIAYLTHDWRLLQLIISMPWISILLIWYCVPESPRWLLEERKIEKLKIIIHKACRMNGRELSDNYEKMLIFATNSKDKITDPFLMIFRKKYRMITVLTLIQWFSMVIVYFGLALHIGKVGGNLYVITGISGFVEALGIILSILTVLKFGLRKNLMYLMIISSVACFIIDFLPDNYEWIKIALGITVKAAAGIANFINPIFTALQYPTVVRNLGIGIGNFGSGIALLLVPYMWLLSDIATYIPFIIMGINGLIGAFSFFLIKSPDNKNVIKNT